MRAVQFQTNITGVVNTIFPLLTAMRSRGKGQIAIVSSLASFMPMGGSAAYSASKAAVRMYGEGLRLVLRRDGINVNVICPGYIESPMTAVQKVGSRRLHFLICATRVCCYCCFI